MKTKIKNVLVRVKRLTDQTRLSETDTWLTKTALSFLRQSVREDRLILDYEMYLQNKLSIDSPRAHRLIRYLEGNGFLGRAAKRGARRLL
jgi:hypothetical protein